MLKGIKRTKNNDLVINDKGLSVLNILCVISVLSVLFFFIPTIKIDESESMSLFGLVTYRDYGYMFSGVSTLTAWIWLLLIYPIVNIVMWVLNKKSVESKSYMYVHIIYMLNISIGFLHFTTYNVIVRLSGNLFAFLCWLILLANLVISIYAILKTGRTAVDENATALDLNVDYAKGILNKAGNMATNVANNVSAAASKAAAGKTVNCDKCGAACPETSAFCNNCGNSLDNVKKMMSESKATASNTLVCEKCGNVCSEGATFCTKCGNNLADARRVQAEAQNRIDEAAKLAREMATDNTANESTIKNGKDDTKSNGVLLSK